MTSVLCWVCGGDLLPVEAACAPYHYEEIFTARCGDCGWARHFEGDSEMLARLWWAAGVVRGRDLERESVGSGEEGDSP